MQAYLDNAATTAVLPQAAQAAARAMTEEYGNPSSLHPMGRQARELLQKARAQVARAVSCAPEQLVFTSCGTESINTALRAAARKNRHTGRHIVSTAVEHDAVLNTLKALAQEGFEVTLVEPERDGLVSAEKLCAALRPDTILLSLMAVNNETGAVLPVEEAAAAARKRSPAALVHVDGVQALCKQPFSLENVDLASFSAHKIGGMKGCGALYIKKGLSIAPLLLGGGQENGLRSGTEGMPQIAAFGAACEVRMQNRERDAAHMCALRQRLLAGARALGAAVNSPEKAAPHIVNLSMQRGRSEVYIRALGERGVCVSGGSACTRGRASHVLLAQKLPKGNIDAALRVSLCPESTAEMVDLFLDALGQAARLF